MVCRDLRGREDFLVKGDNFRNYLMPAIRSRSFKRLERLGGHKDFRVPQGGIKHLGGLRTDNIPSQDGSEVVVGTHDMVSSVETGEGYGLQCFLHL